MSGWQQRLWAALIVVAILAALRWWYFLAQGYW